MIASFQNIKNSHLRFCGGKGESLIRMKKSGFNVPDGFVICSDEFQDFCKSNGLNATPLENMWSSIISGIIPTDISRRILSTYAELFPNGDKVAVRSSALCEDGANYAWSGELETFLFIDESNLIESVKKCFASIFTERALAYAKLSNVEREQLQVAVVVQRQIDSEFAGVAFSNDPLTGKNEITVESVEGQGERLVSGQTIPDNYVYSYDYALLHQKEQYHTHLSKTYLFQILNNVMRLKSLYKSPVDVEWARPPHLKIIQNSH